MGIVSYAYNKDKFCIKPSLSWLLRLVLGESEDTSVKIGRTNGKKDLERNDEDKLQNKPWARV